MQECKEYTVTHDKDGKENRHLDSKLDSMLLNGSHVCVMIPGDNPNLN